MSFFNSVEQDFFAVKRWFEGNPVGAAIEADFRAAAAELEKIAVADLENAVKVIGLNVLAALATGGSSAAIAAGISSAITEFKAVGADVSHKAINTLVTTVVNQVSAQTTPVPITPPSA
jgi:1-aminocyclopropane-1-carboxylate deaminase/D-cysteine desulfhydrase-like pyridoxal-dependent ACC family enzyme